jgi:hypothetical protein
MDPQRQDGLQSGVTHESTSTTEALLKYQFSTAACSVVPLTVTVLHSASMAVWYLQSPQNNPNKRKKQKQTTKTIEMRSMVVWYLQFPSAKTQTQHFLKIENEEKPKRKGVYVAQEGRERWSGLVRSPTGSWR